MRGRKVERGREGEREGRMVGKERVWVRRSGS